MSHTDLFSARHTQQPLIRHHYSRAQHEAVARKMKLEAKQSKGAIKKVPAVPAVVELEQQKNGQTTKLVNQIAVLKDQNRSLEGKVQVIIINSSSNVGCIMALAKLGEMSNFLFT